MSRKDGPRSEASDTDGSTDTQLGQDAHLRHRPAADATFETTTHLAARCASGAL